MKKSSPTLGAKDQCFEGLKSLGAILLADYDGVGVTYILTERNIILSSSNDEVKSFLDWAKASNLCLPSPTHYPLQFAYYVRLYRFYERNTNV